MKTEQAPQTIIVIPPRRGSSLGLASIIVGILGLLICWIPFLNMLGLPLSGLGLLLGVVGLLVALARKGSGIGFPVAGLMICGLALFIAVSINNAASSAIFTMRKNVAKERQERNATNQQVVGANPASTSKGEPKPTPPPIAHAAVVNGQMPGASASSAGSAATTPRRSTVITPTPSPTPQEVTWAPVDQPVKQGDIVVKVAGANVSKINLGNDVMGQPQFSKDPNLWIQLQITNTNTSLKIDYRTWAGQRYSRERDFATLTDDFGNQYKRIDFGLMFKPLGRVDAESIYPNRYIADILVYEPPVPNAQYLNLELPAGNFGGTGMLRIRIPLQAAQAVQQ